MQSDNADLASIYFTVASTHLACAERIAMQICYLVPTIMCAIWFLYVQWQTTANGKQETLHNQL